MKSPVKPLAATQLFKPCDIRMFKFKSTASLEPLTEMVGQDRAVEAVEFAVGMPHQGFNLYVLGPPGTGRHSFIRRYLGKTSGGHPPSSDWCYVNNFESPRRPIALALPAGRGSELRDDIERLVDEAYTAIPTAFESEDYRSRREAIEQAFQEAQATRFQEIQARAREKDIAIIQSPNGIAFAPLRDGRPIPPQELQALSDEEKERLEAETEKLGHELQDAMRAMPGLVRDVREKIRELDREIAVLSAGSLIDDLVEKYGAYPKVVSYLESIQSDIIENVQLFLASPEEHEQMPFGLSVQQPKEAVAKRRYCVNLLVDRRNGDGAPLVFEDHPTYQNLIGDIEYLSQMGALVTDFSLIKSGALHRANGGYLVIDAHKLLSEPFAWQGLKQALKSREVKIEAFGQAYSLIRTATLEPEPIPLDLKVVLVGDRQLYYLLQALDNEFMELFKVSADFDDRMERNPKNNRLFAQLMGSIAKQEELKPLDPGGVGRLIEESARHAGHAGKLSAQVRRAADIMREADHWAEMNGHEIIGAADIDRAIESRIHRAGRLRERVHEDILEETVLIDTQGAHVGQVNGLAVYDVGDDPFARPNRITARVTIGAGKVIDIEREAKLGGPLHSKGVLILSGFLASHYVTDIPLSLAASVVLEQSYGGVEGDSASSTELYALISAIAEVPIQQGYAVTGSVNQHGEVQAIGGVNEKIEGFFDICDARGLTGDQGVLIPASNVKHLMLRRRVVEAVEAGRFAIYPVSTIDEGISILTGLPAGKRDAKGEFPKDSVNGRVVARLRSLAERRLEFAGGTGDSRPASAD